MKEKIISQLKAKYPGVNLSSTRIDAIADKLAAKITDEKDIDAKLDELNDIMPFADIAKQDDKLRLLEVKLNKKPTETTNQTDTNTDRDKSGDTEPDLKQQFQELSAKLAAMEKKDAAAQLYQTLTKKLTEKKIPLAFAKGRVIETEEQLNTVLAEVEADYTEVKQGFVNDGLKDSSDTPFSGQGKPEGVKTAIKEWGEKEKAKV